LFFAAALLFGSAGPFAAAASGLSRFPDSFGGSPSLSAAKAADEKDSMTAKADVMRMNACFITR